MFHLCSGCLRKSFGVETRGRKPSNCSFALNVLLLPQKLVDSKPWYESQNLWIHLDSSTLSQSFAVGNPDTSCWMHGMTPHSGMGTGRQRAEAVVRKGLCYSRQAAKNPAPGSRSQHWQCQVFTHHSWSAASTSGSFRRQEVERGSMAECIIGIYTSSMFGMTKTF